MPLKTVGVPPSSFIIPPIVSVSDVIFDADVVVTY
jgi:hypothetical protein